MIQSIKRFTSLDFLRGLTIAAMILVNTPGSWSSFPPYLQHTDWHGCNFADLIFPFFLFIAGASIAFSTRFNSLSRSRQWVVLLQRVLLLFAIGLFLNAFPFYHKNLGEIRIMGVLQRIALAYGLAYSFILLVKPKFQIYGVLGMLILYHALFELEGSIDPYSLEDNILRRVDIFILGPDHMWTGKGIPFDPEGILGSLSAACSVWLGYFIARIIRSAELRTDAIPLLAMTGLVMVGLGMAWDRLFPINKYLWTSSFTLYTAGLATVTLIIIMLIPDKWLDKWGALFVSAGKNPLLLFVASILWVKILIYVLKWTDADGNSLNAYQWAYDELFIPALGQANGSVAFALVNVALFLLVGWLLNKRGVFIRI